MNITITLPKKSDAGVIEHAGHIRAILLSLTPEARAEMVQTAGVETYLAAAYQGVVRAMAFELACETLDKAETAPHTPDMAAAILAGIAQRQHKAHFRAIAISSSAIENNIWPLLKRAGFHITIREAREIVLDLIRKGELVECRGGKNPRYRLRTA